MDYRRYRCDMRDNLKWMGASLGITAALSWLFYRSWYGMALVVPVGIFWRKRYIESRKKERQRELLNQFKDGMRAVSAALLAGYSVENAWREAETELCRLYGRGALMSKEWHEMNARIEMNEPIEKPLLAFAARSGCEDVESFAEVFAFAKRSGGNFAKIIRTAISRIKGKMEVEQEIATVLAGKKLEGRIMNVMPLFILAYMNLTSKEFLQVLYGNPFGVLVMTAALGVYAVALKLSDRILDICI